MATRKPRKTTTRTKTVASEEYTVVAQTKPTVMPQIKILKVPHNIMSDEWIDQMTVMIEAAIAEGYRPVGSLSMIGHGVYQVMGRENNVAP